MSGTQRPTQEGCIPMNGFALRGQTGGLDSHSMESAIQELISRVERFEMDESGVPLPFTSRLARENGWSHAEAARVVREYKRFVVLAMVAGHPVTPSEAVDQAWHLHLVYTRSYWHGLCRDTLGRELHHGPNAGGQCESEKFVDWYTRTLESYRLIFNEKPPAAIWPDPARRFEDAGMGRWVNTREYWLIPKPRWTRLIFRSPRPNK
jgi:hypothetical protein